MAQEALWMRPADLTQQMPWLNSENAAGLTVLSPRQRIADVQMYGELFSGALRNYHEADDAYRWGLQASSFYRISERVAVWGEVDYSSFQGKNMTGSYFIDPTQVPFNLVEFTQENPGDKQLETYHLAGAVGVALTSRWSAGFKANYAAANYAKRKDLRHTNSLMDMALTAGAHYRLTPALTIGANYAYRRRNESLLLSMYGTTDRLYYSLVDYGAFFGKRELFGDAGYTKENESKPLFDTYHGGALQLSWRIGKRWEWFNEVGFRTREGYYGDDSPSTIVYSTHDGQTLNYNGQLVYTGAKQRHALRLEAGQHKVENRENKYSFRNDDVGINYYVYLGDAKVGTRTQQQVALHYTAWWDISEGLPRWQADVQGSVQRREQLAINYPDYRRQDITWWQLMASLQRNLGNDNHLYTVGVNLGYAAGQGDLSKDGKYTTSNETSTLTRTLNSLLLHDYEYHTATRVLAGADLRYTHRFNSRPVRGYVALRYDYSKAFNTTSLGNAMRHQVVLRLGCLF